MMKAVIFATLVLSAPALAEEVQPIDEKWESLKAAAVQGPALPSSPLCEGDGCDAYLPVALFSPAYRDEEGARRRNAVIGAATGAVIGEKVGGVPAAIGLASLGAAMGYNQTRAEMEARMRPYHEAWMRGDDIYYNPVYTIPANPHYWGGKRQD